MYRFLDSWLCFNDFFFAPLYPSYLTLLLLNNQGLDIILRKIILNEKLGALLGLSLHYNQSSSIFTARCMPLIGY